VSAGDVGHWVLQLLGAKVALDVGFETGELLDDFGFALAYPLGEGLEFGEALLGLLGLFLGLLSLPPL
jgi:hypothetical protein